jgi:lytic murein transglycosylase
VDAARIMRGRARYLALRPILERVEQDTGVPEKIMLAIYGHETNYGAFSGNFDLADALATLAYEGRRRALFIREFISVLKMMDRGIPRTRLKGSWAGATGYPQFLPSVYLRVARDGDGDNVADIWTNEADALASIASYFKNAGWRAGVPWGVAARVPEDFTLGSVRSRLVPNRCPRVHGRHSQWKSIAEWRALGVVPINASLGDKEQASLFQPDGPGTPAWLLTGNYRVILDYNCSNFYALSVGLLADAVAVDNGS